MRAVISREPYLIHTVVEADDTVLGHDGPDVPYEALRDDRKVICFGTLVDVAKDTLSQCEDLRVGFEPSTQSVGQHGDTRSNVANQLRVGMKYFLHACGN